MMSPSDSDPAGPYVAGGPVGPLGTLSPSDSDSAGPAGPAGPYVAGGPVGQMGRCPCLSLNRLARLALCCRWPCWPVWDAVPI